MGVSVESTVVTLGTKVLLPNDGNRVALELEQRLSRHAHHHHHHVSFEPTTTSSTTATTITSVASSTPSPRSDTDEKGKESENEDDEEDEDEAEEEDVDWVLRKDPTSWGGVDERDSGTADHWVHRHPEMVRLTGRHPFNSEAPLSVLMQQGFITPASLHYVRNHGPVPRTSWENWSLEITGLVRNPVRFSMDELLRLFPQREIPVTLVCAGNRRKEQNMASKSIGFNWGAAGVSTSLWRGVRLSDVLQMVRPIRRSRKQSIAGVAKYVWFEGTDLLPKSGSGYGTCMSIERAMDQTQDVLIAFMQNGEKLRPDHGFPLRLIVPGCIGGRMVKWLSKIKLADVPSENHYHHHDNKVFPSHVDSEIASAEGWWTRPEYVINELNINSVISTPAHGEILPINPGTIQTPYTLGGYAYTGGGRKVTRVEVTMDDGETWSPCEITRPERPTKYGKHWCWVFWQIKVGVVELLQARELMVRAWDESMNTQPKDLIWNLMGMMNNCWFKVKMHPCKGKLGGVAIAFEHPTQPGNQSGGWMVKKEAEKGSGTSGPPSKGLLVKSVSSPFLNQSTSSRNITMSEVRKHSKPESPWIVVNNCVYDCTSFVKEHPGGVDSILINAGSDCTEEFEAIHSDKAKAMLEDYKIGELVMTAPSANNLSSSSADTSPEGSLHGGVRALAALSLAPIIELHSSGRPRALNPKENIVCKLLSSERISADLRRLRFTLPLPGAVLGLPTGKHIFVSAKINGKLCMRAYTPISSDDDDDCVGCFELLIRVYFRGVHPNFPNGGTMSQHLDSLLPGDSINVKGPLGHIQYLGAGCFVIGGGERRNFSRVALMAGGTGITPVYQLIKAVLRRGSEEDGTKIALVYANRTDADIMLREELDEWAAEYPDRFSVWYVLSHPTDPASWKFDVGFVTEAIVREHLPAGGDGAAAFMCGPPPMIEFACLPNLAKHGYSKDSCFQF